MWSSRLFWRILLVYAALSLVSATVFVWILSSNYRDLIETHVQRRLHDSAVILRSAFADDFPTSPSPELSEAIEELGRENNTRITLVRPDGIVVADSDPNSDPAEMEDHSNRPELKRAQVLGVGMATRDSPTLGFTMMYYALPVEARGQLQGFVRVAVEIESVERQVARIQQFVWLTAAGVTLGALILTYFIVRRLVRPLGTLTEAAQAMTQGDFSRRIDVTGYDEFGMLATAFNRMSGELADRINDLRRKGDELRENSELLSTVLGAMTEGVVVVDDRMTILFANRSARPLLNFETPNVVGKTLYEAARHPTVHETVRNVLQRCSQQSIEFEVPRSESHVSMVAIALPGDPCPGAVLVLHDVTELRRLESMRREFVSNVSHELKTPLSSIQAYAETLLEGGAIDDPQHNRKFLQRIVEQSERLHTLIMELLSLARIESGRETFDLVPVRISQEVAACLEEYQPLAEAKQVRLSAQPSASELEVIADVEGLRTILNNLVDNAIKYTPEGGDVRIRWNLHDSRVAIEVEDTGVGIPKSQQNRIFERFYRVDKARSREVGGTGLGLSIVKHLAQVFGGSVEVRSEPNVGTTFTVKLPAATAVPPDERP